jgi:hypothetical protein
MPVTVGKIEDLARHFRGEGGALLPPPHGIFFPWPRTTFAYDLHTRAVYRIAAVSPLAAREVISCRNSAASFGRPILTPFIADHLKAPVRCFS